MTRALFTLTLAAQNARFSRRDRFAQACADVVFLAILKLFCWAWIALLLVSCADYGPRLAALEAERAELRAKLVEANGQLRELAKQVDDVRALSLIGGPRRRYKVGVDCNDGPHVPGSFGEAAHRALFASGWCPGQVLPVPPPMLVRNE